MKNFPLLLAASLLISSCESTKIMPSHEIPVRNEYIEAGIQAGDTVEITMSNGETQTIEVVAVGFNVIEGPEGEFQIGDIERIVKRSWKAPGHPCGANEPVGCSIPEVALLVEQYSEQAAKFHPACVTHDFCYRHGYATYDETREQCDATFLRDMKEVCGGPRGLNILDLQNYSICNTSAQQTFNAVRLKGEPHFRTTTSSVCEYKLGSP
jgi:hypothetical protein